MSSGATSRVVRVTLDGANVPPTDRSYEAVVCPGVLENGFAQELDRANGGEAVSSGCVHVVVDAGLSGSVAEGFLGAIRARGVKVTHSTITPSEAVKSLATLETLLVAMTEARLERGDLLVALGGGIVGDVAGFAAASYRRGIGFVQCPTTLLSMVDASVGGKTGVNIQTASGLKKNMAGAFHQPRRVVIDPRVLGSLPPRHMRAGLAECIKHSMLSGDFGDPDLGDFLATNMAKFLACDEAAVTELIARNVAIKARVVEGDEREEKPVSASTMKPGRMALNLGHTFGHALETMPGLTPDGDAAYSPLHHGEAVALGTLAAACCSRAMGLAEDALVERTRQLLEQAGLPTTLKAVPGRALPPIERIIEAMHDDKKVGGGKLRLVLPCHGSRCVVMENPPIEAVRAGLVGIGA